MSWRKTGWTDVRVAFRWLRRSPTFALIAAGSLALGIGATTVVYGFVDRVLLHPLPSVPAVDELLAVVGFQVKDPQRVRSLAWDDYRDLAARHGAIRQLAATVASSMTLSGRGAAERIDGLGVSSEYFGILGLHPRLGRFVAASDENAAVAVLGQELWRRSFGADLHIVGRTITVNGKPLEVIGVAPQGFAGTDLTTRTDLWFPIGSFSRVARGAIASLMGQHDRQHEWLAVIGRLAPGADLRAVQADFNVVSRRLAAVYPKSNASRGVRVMPLTAVATGSSPESRRLLVLFIVRLGGVAALVWIAAVLNVSSLFLARTVERRRETGIRLSLGAGRGTVMGHLVTEGLILGCGGVLGGIGLVRLTLPLLSRLQLPVGLHLVDLPLSWRAVGFAALLGLVSSIAFSLLPALRAAHREILPSLSPAIPLTSRFRWRVNDLLVALQLAAAMLILTGAVLLVRSLRNLDAVDPGFEPKHVLAAGLDLGATGLAGDALAAFDDALLLRVRGIPGVADASLASALPSMGGDLEVDLSVAPDRPAAVGSPPENPGIRHVLVGSHFFRTVGLRFVKGRDFGDEDRAGAGVVILNQTAARQLFPGRDPVGRTVALLETKAPFTVVGEVSDSIYARPQEDAQPVLYLSHLQGGKSFVGGLLASELTLLVRNGPGGGATLSSLRGVVTNLDGRLPLGQVRTLAEILGSTVGIERQAAVLCSGLALVALALAVLGLYGALHRTVVERHFEIAIRMACGATRGAMRRYVFRRSVLLAVVGSAAGMAVAVPGVRLIASLLFGIDAYDPLSWLLPVGGLLATALLVSAVPSFRAGRILPAAALRRGAG
jgi:predicted permease